LRAWRSIRHGTTPAVPSGPRNPRQLLIEKIREQAPDRPGSSSKSSIPDYPFGTKRSVRANGVYIKLRRTAERVDPTGIREITENGITRTARVIPPRLSSMHGPTPAYLRTFQGQMTASSCTKSGREEDARAYLGMTIPISPLRHLRAQHRRGERLDHLLLGSQQLMVVNALKLAETGMPNLWKCVPGRRFQIRRE